MTSREPDQHLHKKIILTGGGTAGHVTPNLALLPRLREAGFEVSYIGSVDGMEKELVEKAGLPYKGIATGKLRRYFDWKNFTDPFRVIKGLGQAHAYLRRNRTDVIFSKGGFVSVPVILAAAMLKIPCILHESDLTPGLANRICLRYATRICCNFPETLQHLPADKAVLTGTPIREELFHGDRAKGLAFCGFSDSEGDRPVLLVMGGSLGAESVNLALRDHLSELLEHFRIIHLCGRGKVDETLADMADYRQFEYIGAELPDLFAAADLVLSRAGANAICELHALKKPHVLVPLPTGGSRGDQLLNAASFEKRGFSRVVPDEEMSDRLVPAILDTYNRREEYIKAMAAAPDSNAADVILQLVQALASS